MTPSELRQKDMYEEKLRAAEEGTIKEWGKELAAATLSSVIFKPSQEHPWNRAYMLRDDMRSRRYDTSSVSYLETACLHAVAHLPRSLA